MTADFFGTLAIIAYGIALLIVVPGALGLFGFGSRLDDSMFRTGVTAWMIGNVSWVACIVALVAS